MQWLIDMIIDRIGIPPVYIDRGDSASIDFLKDDLTLDGSYQTLDLSNIVPAGASAIAFRITLRNASLPAVFRLVHPDHSIRINRGEYRVAVANVSIHYDAMVGCDANRNVTYWGSNVAWVYLSAIIKGWWL